MSVPIDPNPAVEVALAPRGNPDPQQNVRILLGDRDHIYRTGDYGHTWATTFTDDGSGYQSLFVSPANPQRLYSMFGFGWRWPEDLNYQDFARSDDAGVTWSVVKGLVTISGCGQFTPSPILPARAYLDCDGWNQSDDGGQTWTPKTLPGLELALDAQDPAWLYMLDLDVYGNPIFGRSTDGGGTWTPWSSTPCVTDHVMPDWLMAHPSKTHVLFLNCSSGLYRSTDAGDHWSQLTSTTGPLLAPDYGVPGRILWARQDGLWASMDDGDHWQLLYGLYQTSWAFLPLIQR